MEGIPKAKPSVEELLARAETLNVEADNLENEVVVEDVPKKAEELGNLFQTLRRLENSLMKSQEAFEHFQQINEAEEGTNLATLQSLEKAQDTVSQIQQMIAAMDEKSKEIYASPSVHKHIVATAYQEAAPWLEKREKETAEAKAKSIEEEARRDLTAEIDKIIQETLTIVKDSEEYKRRRTLLSNEIVYAKEGVRGSMLIAVYILEEGIYTRTPSMDWTLLEKGYAKAGTIIAELHEKRNTLGWRDGKKKEVIDEVLAKEELFTTLEKTMRTLEEHETNKPREFKNEEPRLIKDLEKILQNAAEAHRKIIDLGVVGKIPLSALKIPAELLERIQEPLSTQQSPDEQQAIYTLFNNFQRLGREQAVLP